MLLFVDSAHPTIAEYAHPNLGRLVGPRQTSSIETTARSGVPWAADNDCFQRLDVSAYLRLLGLIHGLPGCRFVTVPDVVGDAELTDYRWERWAPVIREDVGQPAAYVAQDGCVLIPDDADALFIGGTDDFKTSHEAEYLVRVAQARGLWVHMGRVNGHQRIRYARSIGCDSVDGSSWSRWKKIWLKEGLASVAAPAHMRIGDES